MTLCGGVFGEKRLQDDHYLGKKQAEHYYCLRFSNSLFEPVGTGTYID